MAVSRAVQKADKATSNNKMTPEIYFARKLAANDKKIRDKSLKKLRRWIAARSAVPDAFSDDELLKLWKGLFYCMWMSDKPLIQEDLAETISSLVHSIVDRKLGLKFISISLQTMAKSWSGIDTWRMDKFMMFVRRIVRHSLEYLAQGGWNEEEVSVYSQILSDHILNANENIASLKVPVGLQLHITNLFLEELAKAGADELSSETIVKMLEPFAKCLATSQDFRLKKDIRQHVFTYLIKQSDEGIEYEEAQEAKSARIRRMKKFGQKPKKKKQSPQDEDSEEEEEEEPVAEEPEEEEDDEEEAVDLEADGDDDEDMMKEMMEDESNPDWGAKDPRAGGVDVVLGQLVPDWNKVADMLLRMASDKKVRSKNRRAMYFLVQWFRDLASGTYPLKVDLPVVGKGLTPKAMKKATEKFIKEELKLTEQRLAEKEESKKKKKKENAKVVVKPQEEEEEDDEELDEEEEMDDEELEMDDEELDEEEEEEDDDDEDEDEEEESSEEEEVVLRPKKASKGVSQPKKSPLAAFEVEDNWEDEEDDEEEEVAKPNLQQLKRKLKSSKKPLDEDEGEVEIVIPNKKYKGTQKMAAPPQPQKIRKVETGKEDRNRRVNFALTKNTAQEPKDYEESLRKSPGLPHDPDRQPSRGGVLKRSSSSRQPANTATIKAKSQRLTARF